MVLLIPTQSALPHRYHDNPNSRLSGIASFKYTAASDSSATAYDVDWIKDFAADGGDKIDISAILSAITNTGFSFNAGVVDSGSNSINWTGTANVAEAMLDTNGEVALKIDLNGDAQLDANDLEIDINNYTGTFDTTGFTV